MQADRFEAWLSRYGKAWEEGDPGLAAELFTRYAEYYETPFDAPMAGREAIVRYWTEGAAEGQRDVRFIYRVISVSENGGVAHWHASFTRVATGNHVELDGMLMAEFDERGRCRLFREWWHRDEG